MLWNEALKVRGTWMTDAEFKDRMRLPIEDAELERDGMVIDRTGSPLRVHVLDVMDMMIYHAAGFCKKHGRWCGRHCRLTRNSKAKCVSISWTHKLNGM